MQGQTVTSATGGAGSDSAGEHVPKCWNNLAAAAAATRTSGIHSLTVPFRYANTIQPIVSISVHRGEGKTSFADSVDNAPANYYHKNTTSRSIVGRGGRRDGRGGRRNGRGGGYGDIVISPSSLCSPVDSPTTALTETSGFSRGDLLLANGINRHQKDFFGVCYLCGYGKHSQNYCPLKLCDVCGRYGHDARVCYFKRSSAS